jgi:hypothetical protein
VHRLTEDVVMKFLPPRVEGGMSYCGRCEKPGLNGWATFILKNPAGLSKVFDFFFGLKEFMEK